MTEEINKEENQGVNISVEQILAAIVNQFGPITIPLDKLVMNYGDKSIAVNQNEDKSVVFTLVDLPKQTEEQEEATAE